MNTDKNYNKPDAGISEVMLGRNASLITVLAITVLAVASVSLIDKRTQGLNVGVIDSLTTKDHFRQAILAIHNRHTPDVIMHRNALTDLSIRFAWCSPNGDFSSNFYPLFLIFLGFYPNIN